MIIRVACGVGLFLGSLAVGWWLGRAGALTEARAARLVRCIVRGPSPLVLCLSIWRMDLRHLAPWLLPLIGTLTASATLLPALVYARRAALSPPQTGSFLTCAVFSNVGYFGAFTAFAFFGEAGYALCLLYFMFFSPCFYTLGFGLAARYGHRRSPASMQAGMSSELRLYPLIGMVVGTGLSLLRIPRPLPLEWINHVLIPADTALYLIAIGSQLTWVSPRPWLRHGLAMSGIKFLYTPLVAWALVERFGVHGLPRQIVLLESAAPVAVSPLVLPLLFGLDRRLSMALWLLTTLLAVPVVIALGPLLARL